MKLDKGKYTHGGQDLLDLVKKYDSPLYVYDTSKIKAQFDRLSKAFSVNIKIKYACKALSNINILKYLQSIGSGLDAVSIQEVEQGLMVGFSPKDIIYTPNCVSFEEIQKVVDKGVMINIDNISILEQFGQKYAHTIPVCIRINPHIMAGGNLEISTGHIDSKFGISIHQLRHVERIVKRTKMQVVGLHMHTGSDILDIDVFLRGADILLNIAHHFKDLSFIDFGSGFKVAYKPNGLSTDIETLGEKLSKRFKSFCKEYGKDLQLCFEPGKFLVSESGVFLAKVNVIKQTTATVFVGLDTGMNHLIRPKLYGAYHHISNISNPEGTKRIYTIVGYICETDTFASDRPLPEVKEGDIIAFHNAGAYAYSMTSNYNSRLRPAEVMIMNGKDYLIRKREMLEDILRNQIEINF